MSEGESTSFTHFQKQQWLVANDPKWITTWWFSEIVLDFFKEHMMACLNSIFVSKQTYGLDKYKHGMESNNSLEYIELQHFPIFLEWFQWKLTMQCQIWDNSLKSFIQQWTR
jgi:hypothetical protein